MTEPVITLDQVSKFYGKVMGLNDITVAVDKGLTGLLGPNGAGKSTMMKLITGQIRPSKGKVRVLGSKVWDNPSLYWDVGYCPEQDSFFPNTTGLEFVTLGARLFGIKGREASRAARKVIRKVEMERDMNRSIDGYSKGMRQRIKIAQGLVHDPRILVLDEPLAGTDPIGRVKIMDLLFDLKKAGKDIVVSSHVLYEIERLTEEVIIINKGKLVAKGNIHDIRDSMDKYPLTVRLRTPQRRKFARLMSGLKDVSTLSFTEMKDELLVTTRDPEKFYGEFQSLVVKNDLRISSIDSPDDNLDAIFKYLVE